MQFKRHPATHSAIVLHQSLNQLHQVFDFVIAQDPLNQCDEAVLSHFLLPRELLGQFHALQDLLHLWSNKDKGFDCCLRQLRKDILKVFQDCRLLIVVLCQIVSYGKIQCKSTVTFLMGVQRGFTKFPCYHSLLYSRNTNVHYQKQDWSQRAKFTVGTNNIKWEPLVDPWKGLMTPSGMPPFCSLWWPPSHTHQSSKHSCNVVKLL